VFDLPVESVGDIHEDVELRIESDHLHIHRRRVLVDEVAVLPSRSPCMHVTKSARAREGGGGIMHLGRAGQVVRLWDTLAVQDEET
jgi:hypothetical protein